MSAAFAEIAAHVQAKSGLALGPDKLYLLETRLAPIMRRENLPDLRALASNLSRSEGLSRAVVEAMTTNESLFFRDGTPFKHLEAALSRLHASRPPGQKLRLWSAAAATGQEAYSLAMTADEVPGLLAHRGIDILGTDIAIAALERARAGLYTPFEVQRGLTRSHLQKYFTHAQGQWRISERLKSLVVFREMNLLNPIASLGMFDVIFCRNVLIYFDPPTKHRVLAAICRQLTPDGLLYLGASETTLGLTPALVRVSATCGVYRRPDPL